MTTDNNNRLQKLSGSDFEIADNQPDIEGWEITDAQGTSIGKVDDMIFDVQALKVRYIIAELNKDLAHEGSGKVLIPIGMAELQEKNDDVILPGISANQISALPAYRNASITPEDEKSIRMALAGAGLAAGGAMASSGGEETDFYDHEHFDENSLYKRRGQQTQGTSNLGESNPEPIQIIEENLKVGKKTVETGGIRLNTRIVEKPVEKDIQLREETVQVERVNTNRPATAADFQEGVIEVKEHAEIPVVNKEAYVVEEVTLNKDVQEREEVIKDTVRSTEVDIEELGKDNITGSGDYNK